MLCRVRALPVAQYSEPNHSMLMPPCLRGSPDPPTSLAFLRSIPVALQTAHYLDAGASHLGSGMAGVPEKSFSVGTAVVHGWYERVVNSV